MLRVWLVLATSIPALVTTGTLLVASSYHGRESMPVAVRPSNAQAAELPGFSLNRSASSPQVPSRLNARGYANSFAMAGSGYQPREEVYLADPSNYDQRVAIDAQGQAVDNDYIVVLHETVGSMSSAINLFQTAHPNDDDQVSYHALIASDGTIVYVVPPEQRAFGAGNSVFLSEKGEESVFTNPEFPSSVNNFAYHISLETPIDGQNNSNATHSGYTEAQYQSLAWLISRSTIPDDRVTTHKRVDRSGSRSDPRSFEAERLFQLLRQYRGG